MTAPIIGAALPVHHLETYRDWLLEKQRDLELQTFHTADILTGDWQPLVDEVKKQLDGYTGRLGIHGPFWGFTIASHDPDIRAVVAKRMDQALIICQAVGATQMVIHSPFTTWDYNNYDNNDNAREAIVERVHLTLSDTVKKAADMGVVLVLENIEDIDPLDRLRLAQSFDSDAVRVSIDTGHAHYAHGSTGAPPVDYYIKLAGEWLNHIHLQDAEGYADRHWAIGEGTIIWPAVFRQIEKLDVEPRLILELRDHGKIPQSMAYLEGLGLGQ
ncbi:MAG: sugar phosphate isomerase/epimerase family protein [Pseudomonadota bacterium]